jgi:YVTN family beta-propeller protein
VWVYSSFNRAAPSIAVGDYPQTAAADASSQSVYVTNQEGGTVSVIDTTTRGVTDTIQVGGHPHGMAIDPGSHTAYVADYNGGAVSVIDTSTRRVTGSIPVGGYPDGVAVDPATHAAYVVDYKQRQGVGDQQPQCHRNDPLRR